MADNGRLTLFRDITSVHTYNEFYGVQSFDSSTTITVARFRGNGQFRVFVCVCVCLCISVCISNLFTRDNFVECFVCVGMLTIINHTCYYYIYGVDPKVRKIHQGLHLVPCFL